MISLNYLWLLVGAFVLSLFFEVCRDYYLDLWGYIIEGWDYFVSFDWWSDFVDFLGSAFEDISELSIYGLAFGILAFITIFYTRSYMIEPFVKYYGVSGRIFWTIATYVTVFVGGYLLGKAFENTS